MKIFLTGATGFIGSHFLRLALQDGHTVLALRREKANSIPNYNDLNFNWLVRQLDTVSKKELVGCDTVVHFAAHSVQYPFDSLSNCLRWNLSASLSLFEQARLAGIRNFIVAGSCFEYGLSCDHYDAVPIDAPLLPTNSYGASKAAASIALCQWALEHDMNLEILRVFHVYGPGESSTRLWPSLHRAAIAGHDFPMTAGDQIRDFLPVEVVAQIFLDRVSFRGFHDKSYRVYNIGSGNHATVREFSQYWWNRWNAKGVLLFNKVPYRPLENMRLLPGPDLLKVVAPVFK